MSSATITTSARLMNFTPQTEEQAMVRKVAVSSFLGNFIEWFDYASYSYFATTIALVFFPTDNHTVAMLQTFGVFALSFTCVQSAHCSGVATEIRKAVKPHWPTRLCSCPVRAS